MGAALNYAENRYVYKFDINEDELVEGVFGGNGKGIWKSQKNAQVIDGQGNAAFTHYFGDGNYFSFTDIFYGTKIRRGR